MKKEESQRKQNSFLRSHSECLHCRSNAAIPHNEIKLPSFRPAIYTKAGRHTRRVCLLPASLTILNCICLRSVNPHGANPCSQ